MLIFLIWLEISHTCPSPQSYTLQCPVKALELTTASNACGGLVGDPTRSNIRDTSERCNWHSCFTFQIVCRGNAVNTKVLPLPLLVHDRQAPTFRRTMLSSFSRKHSKLTIFVCYINHCQKPSRNHVILLCVEQWTAVTMLNLMVCL
jgi:hypothetical protein